MIKVKFGKTLEEQNELANLVLEGKKKATSSLYYLQEIKKAQPTRIGDIWQIQNGQSQNICRVQVTKVRVKQFSEIDETFARAEGDRTLTNWKRIHDTYYTHILGEYNKVLEESTLLECVYFEKHHENRDIYLKSVKHEEVNRLQEIMEASFNYDTEIYFGKGEKSGPTGYDDGSLAKKIMMDKLIQTRFIMRGEKVVGFISWERQKCIINYFCISPEYINQGIGTRAWQLFEEMYQESDWLVETPSYSKRNHFFYEKLGFKKIGEKNYGFKAQSYLYKKARI